MKNSLRSNVGKNLKVLSTNYEVNFLLDEHSTAAHFLCRNI